MVENFHFFFRGGGGWTVAHVGFNLNDEKKQGQCANKSAGKLN